MTDTKTMTQSPQTSNGSPSRGPIQIKDRILGNGVPTPTVTTQDIADWLGEPDTNHRILRSYDLSVVSRSPEFIRAHFLPVHKDGSAAFGTKRRGMVIMDAIGADCVLEWMAKHKTAFPKMVYIEARRAFCNAFSVYRGTKTPLLNGEKAMETAPLPPEDAQPKAVRAAATKKNCGTFDPVSPRVIEAAELTAFLIGNGYSKADAVLAAVVSIFGDSPTLRGILSENGA